MCPKWTKTRSPWTSGVGLAWLFFVWIFGAVLPFSRKTSLFQRVLPLLASRHTAVRPRSPLWLPSTSTAVVSKTRSATTDGDDHPLPGTVTFQTTFLSGPQVVGSLLSVACPCPVGPRN